MPPKKPRKKPARRPASGGKPRGAAAARKPFLLTSASLVALALGLTLVLCLVQAPAVLPEPERGNSGTGTGQADPEGSPALPQVLPQALPQPLPADRLAQDGTAPDRAGPVVALPAPVEKATGELFDAGRDLSRRAAARGGPEGTARPAARLLPPPVKEARGPRLVFVIDDVGYSLAQLEAFLKLPFPLTFAVLPGLPHSEEAARMIRAAGKELILHQPMESVGGSDPGPGAVYLYMSPAEAAAVVRKNLDSLPGVVGMNNHEGSTVTRDDALMGAILAVAKSRGIYYLDSLTISDTATADVALRERIRYWERDVFLDNSPDRISIVHYIDVGRKKAEKSGAAVMIGHVWSAELAQTLSDLYPSLVEGGFSLSTISKVMLEEADAGTGD